MEVRPRTRGGGASGLLGRALRAARAESGAAAGRPRAFLAVETAAAAVTVACVWLTARESILCWPTGILGALLYMYVFFKARLYSDVLLQLYFLATGVWGWYNWLFGGKDATELPIARVRPLQAVLYLSAAAAVTAVLGAFMKRRTKAAMPYVDAATTALSLAAQILLGNKILENWVLWIAADAVDTGVYFRRRLYPTALLYLILLGLAVMGLVEWTGKLPR